MLREGSGEQGEGKRRPLPLGLGGWGARGLRTGTTSATNGKSGGKVRGKGDGGVRGNKINQTGRGQMGTATACSTRQCEKGRQRGKLKGKWESCRKRESLDK